MRDVEYVQFEGLNILYMRQTCNTHNLRKSLNISL